MIRMIANNTSDYVATDLIHHLWCQHHEKYGHKFENEPHQSMLPCLFDHSKSKFFSSNSYNKPILEKPTINKLYETTGNYASFPHVIENSQHINLNSNSSNKVAKGGEYFGIDLSAENQLIPLENQSRLNTIDDNNEKNFLSDEKTNLIRKRENTLNFNAPSTKV